MNAWTFIRRGIWHYRLSYFGVLAGAILGATVLLGALFAGDSVKGTLKQIAANRIGQADHVLSAGEGFFREALAAEVRREGLNVAPILYMKGQLSAQESGRAVGEVQIIGVDDSFWELAPVPGTVELPRRELAVNEHLAQSLGLATGETVIMRVQEPGMLSRDAPLSGEAEDVISFRGAISRIVGDEQFGRFSLQATQLPTPTVYVPIARLQEVIGYPAKANLLLIDQEGAPLANDVLLETIRARMTLEDYGLALVDVPLGAATEIRSDRIFLETRIVDTVMKRFPGSQPVVSYLANTLAANDRETPYSMVTAADPAAAPFLPADLKANEVVINTWLAEDLGAAAGQELDIKYFQLATGNKLTEASRTFTIRSIVPLEGLAADRLWMPDFPGVAEAENAEDWSPGLPLDLKRIRQKDEDYWDDYRGTPKAFLTPEAGRDLFGNRWGDFTSLRIPVAEASRDEVEQQLLPDLRPDMAGILLRDFRGEALSAAASPVDIGQLFLSMSFFLIVAAVSLTAMLFRFNVEQRNEESGLLAAVGVPAGKILRWRLLEGFCVVLIGGVIGLLLALAYSVGILRFLETIWGSGGSLFSFHFNPASAIGGLLGFVLISMGAIWLAVRKQARKSATLRLTAGTEEVRRGNSRTGLALGLAVLSLAAGVASLALRGAMGPQGAFFLSGVCFLVAGLAGYRAWLAWSGARSPEIVTPASLATMNSGRRPVRSLVVVGTLACGVFLVIAVTAFQKHGGAELAEKSSGTGGYAFWIETTSPVNRAADAKNDPDYFELGDERKILGEILPFRIGVGDDASCFNLNTASRPRLIATNVQVLADRGSFSLRGVAEGLEIEKGWGLLLEPAEDRVLRALIDETTLMWVLKMKIGERLTYLDEWGAEFEVEIAGTLADSVFQGSFVVDEAQFLRFFPSQEGYRLFLADATGDLEAARAEIQKANADRGGSVTLTRERLESFHAVENTYIAIFHVLGGLGLLLGSAGIGIVTARNLAERRSEFNVLETVGVPHRISRQVIFKEVRAFIAWALLVGVLAAVVAIIPALTGTPPVKTLIGFAVLIVAIGLNSLLWAWFGYRAGYERRGV